MDLIGLDASIVKGSHGRLPDESRMETDAPLLICSSRSVERDNIQATDVRDMILKLHEQH